MKDNKYEVVKRIAYDLEWLYNNAEDKGERDAVSFVEDIVHNWLADEINKRFK